MDKLKGRAHLGGRYFLVVGGKGSRCIILTLPLSFDDFLEILGVCHVIKILQTETDSKHQTLQMI